MSRDWTAALSPGHLGRLQDALEVYGSERGTILDVDHHVVRIKGRAVQSKSRLCLPMAPIVTHF